LITYPQLRQVLLFVHGETFNFVEAEQNGNVPAKPYGTYKINWVSGAQRGHEQDVEPDGSRLVIFNRKSQIDINFYGESAFAEAEKLSVSLGLPTVIDFASSVGLEINTRENVVNLSDTVNNQRQNRAMLEFSCLWNYLIRENVGYIDQLEINSIFPRQVGLDGVVFVGSAT